MNIGIIHGIPGNGYGTFAYCEWKEYSIILSKHWIWGFDNSPNHWNLDMGFISFGWSNESL